MCKKVGVLSKSSTVMFNPVGVILVHTCALQNTHREGVESVDK